MATVYWKGAQNGQWTTNTNWQSLVTGGVSQALTSSDYGVFAGTAYGTVTTTYINNFGTVRGIGVNQYQTAAMTVRGGTSGTPATQTLTIGSSGLGGTVDLSSAGANLTLDSSVNIAFAVNAVWTVGSGLTLTSGGIVSGAYSLTTQDAGTVVLTGVNTYSQGTTVSSTGVIQVGNNSALGSGTVTMTGGKLSSASTTGYTLANAFSLNASGGSVTLTDATNTGTLTLTGNMTVTSATSVSVVQTNNVVDLQGSLQGSGALTLTAGQMYLNKATGNTFSGAVTINGGIFYLGRDTTEPNQFGGGATLSTINITSGSLYFGGTSAYTVNNTITSPANAASVLYGRTRNTTTGLTFTGLSGFQGSLRVYATGFDGAIASQTVTTTAFPTNATNIRYQQSNTVNMTQTHKYAGTASVVSAAPIVMTAATNTLDAVWHHAPSNGTATMTISGLVSSSTAQTHSFDIKNDSSGLLTLSGGIDQQSSGVLSLKKSGTGPATISGTGTFTGTVSVSAGTLNANSATALGAASSTAGISVTSGGTLSLGVAVTYSSRNVAIGGFGAGATPAGALVVSNADINTFGGLSLGSASYVRATASGILLTPWTSNNNNLTLGAASGVEFVPFGSLSNVFSGTGTVTYGSTSADSGIVRADVKHTYTGNTTLAYGTTYVDATLETPGTGGPLGNKALNAAGSLLMTGGTLFYLNGTTDYSGRFSTTGSQQWKINTDTSSVTYAAALAGASSLSHAGTLLTLTGASTFTGGVTLLTGTLNLGRAEVPSVSGPLGQTGVITFLGGTLQYSASNATDYSSRFSSAGSQQWKIDTNGQSVTFASVLAGASSTLTKSGTGTLTLSGNNTYTGATTLNAGTLVAGRATNAFGLGGSPSFTGGLFINGGTLDASVAATIDLRVYLSENFIFGGTADFKVSTLAGVSLSTTASSVAITTNGSGILWFDAPVSEPSGFKGIIKKGNGILRLAAATSSYGGGTEIQAGTLQAGGGGWSYVTGQYLGAITGVTIASSAATLQTMTSLNQRGRLSIASLTNSAGGTIKIGG